MMSRSMVAAAILSVAALVLPGQALANGRFPASVNTQLQPGNANFMLLPSTFGLLVSVDGGATFKWVCEDTIGYGGTYDPDYAITSSGDIYATTFDGLKVSRDGSCTYQEIGAPLAGQWVGEVEVASNDEVWAITSTGGQPNDVYVSTDGTNFTSAGMLLADVWWKSIRIAPSDPDRIYLTGFRIQLANGDAGTIPPKALLYRSIDGGTNWTELDTDDFVFGAQPQVNIVGISPTDPDVVFARVLAANEPIGDVLYRSTDQGETFTKVVDFQGSLVFHMRPDGLTAFAGTVLPCPNDAPDAEKGCVKMSTDGGANWNAAPSEPKMACIGERSDGVMFSCGANWQPDLFALGKSADGSSWDPVIRFSEIDGPLSCPMGTQQFECERLVWPSTCSTLGICTGPDAGPGDDGGPGATCPDGEDCNKGTCGCSVGHLAGIPLFFLPFAWRRRRPNRLS